MPPRTASVLDLKITAPNRIASSYTIAKTIPTCVARRSSNKANDSGSPPTGLLANSLTPCQASSDRALTSLFSCWESGVAAPAAPPSRSAPQASQNRRVSASGLPQDLQNILASLQENRGRP